LSPWLYLAFVGTIFDIVFPSFPVFGFADDHTANKLFKLPLEAASAIEDLEKSAVDINKWMNGNKLKMNNAKTEFILHGSRQQLEKCNRK
jgi:hypothetical protein